MAYWLMYASAVLICVIVILSSTPNAWADKFLAKFQMHPTIGSDSAVSVNGVSMTEKDRQHFIEHFNNAVFRYSYTLANSMPAHQGNGILVTAKVGRKVVNFTVYPHENHIDVVKQIGKQVTEYRVQSESLQQQLLARVSAT